MQSYIIFGNVHLQLILKTLQQRDVMYCTSLPDIKHFTKSDLIFGNVHVHLILKTLQQKDIMFGNVQYIFKFNLVTTDEGGELPKMLTVFDQEHKKQSSVAK